MKSEDLSMLQKSILNELEILDISTGQITNDVSFSMLIDKLNLNFSEFLDQVEPLIENGFILIDSSNETITLTSFGRDFAINNRDFLLADRYDELTFRALNAKKQIVQGFIDLAESIHEVHDKKLYKKEFQTFRDYCVEKIGFSEKTIYIYLKILDLIADFPEFFPRKRAIDFGYKKMRLIAEGITKVEKKISDEELSNEIKEDILTSVSPDMTSKEVQKVIKEKTESAV